MYPCSRANVTKEVLTTGKMTVMFSYGAEESCKAHCTFLIWKDMLRGIDVDSAIDSAHVWLSI